MSTSDSHGHSHGAVRAGHERALWIAFGFPTSFMVAEIVVALITRSLALLAYLPVPSAAGPVIHPGEHRTLHSKCAVHLSADPVARVCIDPLLSFVALQVISALMIAARLGISK